MNLKSATEQLLKNIRKTRFNDLVEVPADCVEALQKALEAENKKEVNKDA
ncbi:MAG: hypothetical protein LKE88_05190 [Acidaminococcus provencensis]|jgi:hypothetical protein|nr:hypothetical protein [Acidaminococcus provencensis]MCH4096021.1 hypothetical protein [Acidaminococcus provencensis]